MNTTPQDMIFEFGVQSPLGDLLRLSRVSKVIRKVLVGEFFWKRWVKIHMPLRHEDEVIDALEVDHPWLYYRKLMMVPRGSKSYALSDPRRDDPAILLESKALDVISSPILFKVNYPKGYDFSASIVSSKPVFAHDEEDPVSLESEIVTMTKVRSPEILPAILMTTPGGVLSLLQVYDEEAEGEVVNNSELLAEGVVSSDHAFSNFLGERDYLATIDRTGRVIISDLTFHDLPDFEIELSKPALSVTLLTVTNSDGVGEERAVAVITMADGSLALRELRNADTAPLEGAVSLEGPIVSVRKATGGSYHFTAVAGSKGFNLRLFTLSATENGPVALSVTHTRLKDVTAAYVDGEIVYYTLADGKLYFFDMGTISRQKRRVLGIPDEEVVIWLSEGTLVTTRG